MSGMTSLLFKTQLWQTKNNINCLHTYIYNTQEQVKNVSRITNLLGPIIGVVFYTTLFIYCHLIPFHYPFNRAFAVNNILIGFGRDIGNCNPTIKYDGVLLVFLWEPHFFNIIESCVLTNYFHPRKRSYSLIVDMQLRKLMACFAICPKVFDIINKG